MLRPEARDHPLAAVLRQVGPDSCPGRYNFHCHTLCSDGSLGPAELAVQAIELGLEHLAITDHHSIAAHRAVAAALEARRAQGEAVPTLWRGVEISALLEGCLVHVLALGFDDQAAALQPYLQGMACVGPALRCEVLLGAIQRAGGLALLAHPARYRLPHGRLIAAAADLGFDGAEAWYDYEQRQPWSATPLICEAIAADLAERGLLQSCGTDTHGLALNGR
ncbi:MAG: PHP domain-containing protein [Synechococcaceae cyanobacterium ELA263]